MSKVFASLLHSVADLFHFFPGPLVWPLAAMSTSRRSWTIMIYGRILFLVILLPVRSFSHHSTSGMSARELSENVEGRYQMVTHTVHFGASTDFVSASQFLPRVVSSDRLISFLFSVRVTSPMVPVPRSSTGESKLIMVVSPALPALHPNYGKIMTTSLHRSSCNNTPPSDPHRTRQQ